MTDDQRLGPPPIEPLSDVAWARVERGVWAELDAEAAVPRTPPAPPRRWWLAAAPLAAAAAVAVILFATRSRPLEIETSRVVSEAAPSSVSFGDSHIELDAATALVMSHEAQHPLVLLERGAAWFTVAPRNQRPAFIVRAADVTVHVVGTRFRVARSEERISVAVDRGTVNVEFHGGVVPVSAGQHWSSDAPTRIAVATPPPQLAPPQSEPPSVEPPVIEMDPAEPVHEPAKSGHKPKRTASDPRDAKSGADSAAASHAPAAAQVADDDPDRVEYDRLAALEPHSPDAALKGYMVLGRGTSRWAALALYAAARLAVDRHDPRATTFLGIYLQRFPDGANAADARKLLARLNSP